jgi:Tfp pilus assembly protein PilO
MRTPQEKKVYILLIAISLLTLGIVLGVIYPTTSDIKSLKEETANLKNFLEKRYQRTIQSRSSVHKIETVREQVALLDKHLFKSGRELEFITLLENLSPKYKLDQKINSSNLDDPNKKALRFNLIISGSYKNALRYLNELENLPYFIKLENISLTPTGQNLEKDSTVRLVLDISLYVSE